MKNNEILCQLYETSIKMLQIIENLSIENKMLDTQEYISWKDNLNFLSIDQDRV